MSLSFVQALKFGNPLARCIISPNPLDSPSELYYALSFLSNPIQKVFSEQGGDIVSIFQRLSILNSRYRSITHAVDVDWLQPFSVDFDFFNDTQQYSPGDLAVRITKEVTTLFSLLSPAAIIDYSRPVHDIGVHWSALCEDTTACAVTDRTLVPYLAKLAEVCIVVMYDAFTDLLQEFMWLRNCHAMVAVGRGLLMAGYRLTEPSQLWALVDPGRNAAAWRAFESRGPCLPFLNPKIHQLQVSGDNPEKLHKIFDFVPYTTTKRLEKLEGKGRALYENICMLVYKRCIG